MKKSLLLFAILSFSFLTMNAQTTGEIHGKVLDERTGEPISFASVATYPPSIGTETDENGAFKLKPLQPGTYVLRFSFTGYNTLELTNIDVTSDNITRVGSIKLEGTELPTVVIVHRVFERPLIDVDNPTVNTLLASEIDHDPNRKNPTDLIVKSFPGVTKARDGEGLIFRGSRSDAMAYFIDGVKATGNLRGVPPSSISSISVYTGALPARYGDVTGGVIVIETKSYQEEWARRRVQAQRDQQIE